MFSFDLFSYSDCVPLYQKGPKLHSSLSDDILSLAAMASLTIHETGAYCSDIKAPSQRDNVIEVVLASPSPEAGRSIVSDNSSELPQINFG